MTHKKRTITNFWINVKMVLVQSLSQYLKNISKSWKFMAVKVLRKHKISAIPDFFSHESPFRFRSAWKWVAWKCPNLSWSKSMKFSLKVGGNQARQWCSLLRNDSFDHQIFQGYDYAKTLNNWPLHKGEKTNFSINMKMVSVQGLPLCLKNFSNSKNSWNLKFSVNIKFLLFHIFSISLSYILKLSMIKNNEFFTKSRWYQNQTKM